MNTLLAVAAGGALGAVGRYLVMVRVGAWLGGHFPFATLTVNILGSFLLGTVVALAGSALVLPPELLVFLTVGVLGAFTTFSTFSLDVSLQLERGQRLNALLYVAGSVVLSLLGFFAGHYLAGILDLAGILVT